MFMPRNTVSKIFFSGIGVPLWPIVQIAVGEDKVNRRKREALVCLTALLFLLIGRIVPSNRMIARTIAYDVLPVVRKYLDCQNCGIR
jgi:hypothetical protein